MKHHTYRTPQPHLPPAYLANGLIGVRLGPNPLVPVACYVNGYVGRSPQVAGETYAQAPWPIAANIQLEGVSLSDRPEMFRFVEQTFDFANGELVSRFDLAHAQRVVHLEVMTVLPRTMPTACLQEIRVTVEQSALLRLHSCMDPAGLEGEPLARRASNGPAEAWLHWRSRGGLSEVAGAYATEWRGPDAKYRRNDWGIEEGVQLSEYQVQAEAGREYVLRQYGCLLPSALHPEPHLEVLRLMYTLRTLGFDRVREDNRAAWAEIWRGRPILHGAGEAMQDTADAAYHYLHASVTRGTPQSVAPFGLSQHHQYAGHVFWDTETFMFPPVLLTNPDAARAMLDYRSARLDAARANARLHGERGLRFPWQSGDSGAEVTAAWAGSGAEEEIHINMDIAFAFAQYAHATGDDLFRRQQAWPVLEGVAEYLTGRVRRTERGYEIHHAMGIDETTKNVNNNCFTNATAVVALREAIAMAESLGLRPPRRWRDVAENMYFPLDPERGILLNHDGYEYTGGVCIPETLAAFFPFGWSHDPAVDAATIDFYLGHAENYIGMPMLSALLGIYAARNGNRELARDLLRDGIRDHLVEPFMQFNEVADPHGTGYLTSPFVTCFLTNPAGFLMSVMYGLTGLHLTPDQPQAWCQRPISLPAGWDAIEIERIFCREEEAHLIARQGDDHAIITPV